MHTTTQLKKIEGHHMRKMSEAEKFCRKSYPKASVGTRVCRPAGKYLIHELPTNKLVPGTPCLACGDTAEEAWRRLRKIIKSNKKFKDVLSKFENRACITFSRDGLLVISWSEKDRGFGEYAFRKQEDGTWGLDNECDSREAVKRILGYLVDSLPLLEE